MDIVGDEGTNRKIRRSTPETPEELPLAKSERAKERVAEWRNINRAHVNKYNRRRNRRLKWEERCGFKLKHLPVNPNYCDICGGKIPLGYQQPYRPGSVCAKCAQIYEFYGKDPDRLVTIAAYFTLVTELWKNDEPKNKREYTRDSKGKFATGKSINERENEKVQQPRELSRVPRKLLDRYPGRREH